MRRRPLLLAAAAGLTGLLAAPVSQAASSVPYLQDDYAQGMSYNVLPPGEHGLYNAVDTLAYEQNNNTRPIGTTDQRVKYDALIYGSPTLTDGALPTYYQSASFGVAPGELTRAEVPSASVPVTIYRDKADVPHIYGQTDAATEFGAGYAGAEDRLFFMDVLRHYGAGTVSAFLGPSCADERMDHDQLLLTGYSDAEMQAQLDAMPRKFGAQGQRFVDLLTSYIDGVNAYISKALTDPRLLPAEYAAAAVSPPAMWTPKDVIAIAGLVGGIFGKGGGGELSNARLLQYLTGQIGAAQAGQTVTALRTRNDPLAPTTIVDKAFPYDIPGHIDPRTRALPDDATRPLTGGPTDTTPNCQLNAPSLPAMRAVASLLAFPKAMSNALVVDAKHSVSGHPLAVFGPQVGYFTPQILMEEELHGPNLVAAGASFAGTNLIVELGRGMDYAWSATSAGTDNVDTRLERLCDPSGSAPAPEATYYLFKGACLPMRHQTFAETGVPKPGGQGAPVTITHELYYTVHGPVQGWTTSGGRPVAVASQRSTYAGELDSGIGFLAWNTPSLTHDATSWMAGAARIDYTFNWLYVDDRDIAYYLSGRDPVRPRNVDPDFPTWGDGTSEWTGFLPPSAHPHEVNPPQGFFTSWNNKPAPQFSAHDTQYAYGAVYRSQSLDEAIHGQFAAHHNRITRAELVQAMESAATVDLSGRRVLPELLPYLARLHLDATGEAMVAQLRAWLADGAHRRKDSPSDAQYRHAAAVAIMDELYPRLIQAVYDPLFAAGGVTVFGGLAYRYNVVPQEFANTPNNEGRPLGSAYDGGFEGFLLTTLRQLRGVSVADAFPRVVTKRWCGPAGPASCPAALTAAFAAAARALEAANGSPDVATWTSSSANKATGQSMPAFDAIRPQAVAIAGQPASDWQNRPTFQQVSMFPRHRPRARSVAGPRAVVVTEGGATSRSLPTTGLGVTLPLAGLGLLGLALFVRHRRRDVP
ncbi:MAG: penicillin acylase family protein [Actinomycetota bacterium]|nr:penicillin acylase family protein [Actinomycetota bacterium]